MGKDLADSWLKKEVEANKTANPALVKGADGTTPTNPTKPVQRPDNAPPLKVEYPPVPPKGPDMRGRNFIEERSHAGKMVLQHKENAKEDYEEILQYLTGKTEKFVVPGKDEVAYVINMLIENGYEDNLFNTLVGRFLFSTGATEQLIAKANELGIEIPKEMNAGDAEQTIVGIKQLTQAIIEKNESAINEMNAFQSIKTPNPELAGKTVVDKATGYEYYYDENGVIDITRDKDGYGVFFRDSSGGFSLDLENGDYCYLDENGNIIEYSTKDNGDYISRNADGSVTDFSIGDIYYYIDQNTGTTSYSTEYTDNNGEVYRDKDGNLICYNFVNSSGSRSYYDANDNEISVDEYCELCPDI